MFGYCIIALLFFSTTLEAMHKSNISNAKSNLDIILSQVLATIPHKFTEDDENVYIETSKLDSENVKLKLSEMFNTRESFQCQLLGKESNNATAHERSINFDKLNIIDTFTAVTYMKKLFGNIFEEQTFSENAFTTKEAKYCDGKLYSCYYNANRCQTIMGFQSTLISYFINCDTKDIQQAFLGNSCLKPYDQEVNEECLAGLMRDSIRLVHLEGGKVCLTLDLERIFNLSFKPTINEIETENNIRFIINKKHMTLHIMQLMLGDKLLRYVKSGDQVYAEQLFITEKKNVAKTPFVLFVIDRSESLVGLFDDIKLSLTRAVNTVWSNNKSSIIRLVFFACKREVSGEYTFDNREKLFAEIKDKEAEGRTRLFETLHEELSEIHARNLLKDHALTVIFFTDGCNNEGAVIDLSQTMKTVVKDNNGFTAIAAGFGKHCDRQTLASLASATHGRSFQSDQLQDLLTHLSSGLDCGTERKLEKIIIQLQEQAVTQALVKVQQDRFGVRPSNIFLSELECINFSPPLTINEANIQQANQITISRAYFDARVLLKELDLSTNILLKYSASLRQAKDDYGAELVDNFYAIVNEFREKRISIGSAQKQIDSLIGVFFENT